MWLQGLWGQFMLSVERASEGQLKIWWIMVQHMVMYHPSPLLPRHFTISKSCIKRREREILPLEPNNALKNGDGGDKHRFVDCRLLGAQLHCHGLLLYQPIFMLLGWTVIAAVFHIKDKKTGIKIRRRDNEPVGLNHKMAWLKDNGSNTIKALRRNKVLLCLDRVINNVLYQYWTPPRWPKMTWEWD